MQINPRVVDISHYDNVSSFDSVAQFGIVGVIHKASEGTGIVDTRYAARRAPAKSAGLEWGAYHFIRPGSIDSQVELFLRISQPDNKTLLALDYETDAVSLSAAQDFIGQVEHRTNRMVVVYSGNTIKEMLGTRNDPWWGKHPLWLAQYTTNPRWQRSWNNYWIWQYTGDGTGSPPHNVPGIEIEGGLDISSYSGLPVTLRREWAWTSTAIPAPIPPGPIAFSQEGNASWYSDGTNADGTPVNNNTDMSAAHKTLPFGTKVTVTRTDTGQSCVVTIHDRGPYVTGRIIDLRPAAARALAMTDAGVVPVRITAGELVA